MEPCAAEGIVIGEHGTAAAESGERTHVGTLFLIMAKSVSEEKLIVGVELMIEAAGCEVGARCEGR